MQQVAVVIPNWNGQDTISACLDSLIEQTLKPHIIVVENGSTDNSLEFIKHRYPTVDLVVNQRNLGFAGGVNSGIRQALEQGAEFIALFNNDAEADHHWLEYLLKEMVDHSDAGIVTGKFMSLDGKHLDSTGDMYTDWGLPYPRGRDETKLNRYDKSRDVFGGSGGASLYRCAMLKEIGLFDEDFFAYYEDIDISFRAHLAGWKVRYVPQAVAYHHIGYSSKKIKGFTTYQTMKNLPLVWLKNVPSQYLWRVGWRLGLANCLFILRATTRHQGLVALRGVLKSFSLVPKKLNERKHIQNNKKVGNDYVWNIIKHDLPPNAHNLRKVRSFYWRITKHG